MRRIAKRGFTLVEIMIVVAIIALLAAIAIPNVLRGRTSANEASAIGNTRALLSSLEMFRSVNNLYPNNGATAWRDSMYEVDCAVETAPTPDFGPPSFCNTMVGGATAATGLVQGYKWTYTGVASGATYTLQATPEVLNNTGTRSFFADESGLIRHCVTAVQDAQATVADNPIDQPPTAAC
ncbi:MAG: prepilin-type N-terminal cleavage/methylation domain-containing protein [Candidatus Omnitrophica bacterium]|nr:prepilin-type N-terminal cleavage/methylation domain-containing protein [Candidatus Omnitrophota bacterium]MBI3021499.1 prepilin-type N-terminal cleavage/methylation domain-containing protein [Candidatus Omnitrophota bacterium]